MAIAAVGAVGSYLAPVVYVPSTFSTPAAIQGVAPAEQSDQLNRSRDFVLQGDSGLVIQSAGAVALISGAGLVLSALAQIATPPLVAPVAQVPATTRSSPV